jgi:hypothetical protein
MSREDTLVLTGLAAIPIWTFAVLPLDYDGVPKMEITKILISLLAPAVAFFALMIARDQLSLNRTSQSEQLTLNRKNQRETTAKTNFREFLKLCVDLLFQLQCSHSSP